MKPVSVRLTKVNTQRLRTWSRVFLMLFATIHMVTWYVLSIHAVGSIRIEALFAGVSKNAPAEMKVLISVGLLLVIYGWV